jgi:WD40 repeat protein
MQETLLLTLAVSLLVSNRSTSALALPAVLGIGFLPGPLSGATEANRSAVFEVPGPVSGLTWLPDGRTLVVRTATIEGSHVKPIVAALDTATGRQAYRIALGYTRAMAVSPNGKWLAVAGEGDDRQAALSIRLADAATGKVFRTLSGHERAVTALAFSRNGKMLASAGQDWLVNLWDAETGQRIGTLKGHRLRAAKNYRDGWGLTALAFAPDDTALVSAGSEVPIYTAHTLLTQPGEFILWDLTTKAPRARIEVRTQCTVARFLPDGKTAALMYGTYGFLRTVCLVDVTTGKKLVERDGFAALFAFRADQAAFARRSSGGERYPDGPYWKRPVEVWDLRAGERVGVLPNYVDHVSSVSLSPDGRVVATAGRDKTVRLWDARSLKPIAKLAGHRAAVRSVAWSPEGSVLASGSEDRTVRLWNRP